MSAEKNNRILIVKLGAMGDIIMCLRHFAFIRSCYPSHHISLLTRPAYCDLLNLCPWFDEVISDGAHSSYNLPKILSVRRRIIKGNFAIIYDLQKSSRSRRYLFAVRAEYRDFPDIPDDFSINKSWLAQSDLSDFGLRKPYMVIVPGAAPHRAIKRWNPENYGKLCSLIADKGFQPVIIGSRHESAIADEILRYCPSALNLTARTSIQQIAAVMSKAHKVIGNDTGPLHISVFLQKPTVVLLSSASEGLFKGHQVPHVTALRVKKLADLSVDEVAFSLGFG